MNFERDDPMSKQGVKRKLTAILSADVVGYSRLMGEDEESTVRTLTVYREIMASLIQQYRGRVVDSPGDNLLAEFASVVDAVQCAVEIQQILKARNAALSENRRMEFRIGINLGDVIDEVDRIYGDGVNIAARLESMAEGGGICISGSAYDQIKNKLAFEYEFLGEHEVKNIVEPVRVYRTQIAPAAKKARPFLMRRKWVALTVIIILVIGAGAFITLNWYLRPDVEPASVDKMAYSLPDKPSIAVLPFNNMSDDPRQEYFADGITEDLITDLSQISDLFVIARNSTFVYKGKPVKIRQVAEELGVRYVLEGSVRKAGDQVRINTQLIDATTGHHLWAKRYDGELSNIFALQDKITQKIVSALAVKLTLAEQKQVSDKDTDNIEAYDNYLQGRQHYLRATEKDLGKAASFFKKATEFDSNYGRAYAALTQTYYKAAKRNWTMSLKVSQLEAWLQSQQYLKSAMKNPTSIAYQAASEMSLFKRLWQKALAEAKQAINLDPNDAGGHLQMGQVLIYSGRPEEAVEYLKRAMRLDPHYPAYPLILLGEAHFSMGQFEETVNLIERASKHNPELLKSVYQGRGSITLAAAYGHLGRHKEAQDAGVFFIPAKYTGLYPFMNSEDADRLFDGIIKLGGTLGLFKAQYHKLFKENKLSGEEIRALVFGRQVVGRLRIDIVWAATGGVGFIDRRKDGKAVFQKQWGGSESGKSWIEDDMLCDQWQKLYGGQKICYAVFRNPDATPEDQAQYLFAIDSMFERPCFFKPMD